jgi:ribonuclease Z
MNLELTIVGSGSAMPAGNRKPSAQIIKQNNFCFLIDCGETTAYNLANLGIKRNCIDAVFISHLHSDHYFGLFSLLSMMHMDSRTKPLQLFAPQHLQTILTAIFPKSEYDFLFDIQFTATNSTQSTVLVNTNTIEITSFPLQHRVPTTGFLFKSKQQIDNSINSYAYCSDTLYTETILPFINDVDVLYHEATFLHEKHTRATETHHSTALQAGEIAKKANVKQLIIGHFSSRYQNLDDLLYESKSVFNNTILAVEGLVIA